jgi:serine/threonine protein kinase
MAHRPSGADSGDAMALTSGVDTVAVQAGLPSYVVNGELDRGGYGITFDAMHAGERLAVKVLDTQSHEAAIRTPLEIAALRSVNDPHVVRMVDEGFLDTPAEPNRYRYIACEFIEGSNLATLATARHAFTVDETLSIGRDVAAGLQALHDVKLVHRDVKPKNVMYNAATGTAVLLDVGIAKHLDVTPVTVGAAPGSFGWKSPEHLRGQSVDRRADLYALGVLLYWLATGKHPFQDRAPAHGGDLESAMLAGQFVPVATAQPALPPVAADVIDQMLALQPYDRPRRAADVIAALR